MCWHPESGFHLYHFGMKSSSPKLNFPKAKYLLVANDSFSSRVCANKRNHLDAHSRTGTKSCSQPEMGITPQEHLCLVARARHVPAVTCVPSSGCAGPGSRDQLRCFIWHHWSRFVLECTRLETNNYPIDTTIIIRST